MAGESGKSAIVVEFVRYERTVAMDFLGDFESWGHRNWWLLALLFSLSLDLSILQHRTCFTHKIRNIASSPRSIKQIVSWFSPFLCFSFYCPLIKKKEKTNKDSPVRQVISLVGNQDSFVWRDHLTFCVFISRRSNAWISIWVFEDGNGDGWHKLEMNLAANICYYNGPLSFELLQHKRNRCTPVRGFGVQTVRQLGPI